MKRPLCGMTHLCLKKIYVTRFLRANRSSILRQVEVHCYPSLLVVQAIVF
jgi:hypothetical protein